MIFYFSGTGNSQLAAKQIAKAVGDKIVSINSLLKEGKEGCFHSERPLVFVAPTYAWRLPRVVTHWISQTRFTGNQNAYFILTCGGDCGNAAAYAHRLCEKKGFAFSGLASVVMPENYLGRTHKKRRTVFRKTRFLCRQAVKRAGERLILHLSGT